MPDLERFVFVFTFFGKHVDFTFHVTGAPKPKNSMP